MADEYQIITDPDYIVQKSDYYSFPKDDADKFWNVSSNLIMTGKSIKILKKTWWHDIEFYKKSPAKPRFPTDKPFPYGY